MLPPATTTLRWCAALFLAAALASFASTLARIPPLRRPLTGVRGEMRKRALVSSPGLRLVEPALLVGGGWVRALVDDGTGQPKGRVLGRVQAWQEAQLTSAGRVWGLDAYELTALSLLSGAACCCSAGAAASALGQGGVWLIPASILGAALPFLRLQTTIAERLGAAARELPAALDLAALCMSAGADFGQSLRYVVSGGRGPLTEELQRALHALEVGHTRRTALLGLAERLPVDAVRELVRALVQAEESGTPLAEALQSQARASRARRSVAAEEAAARAGVLLILPLMLLLGCIVLLLLGPFLVGSPLESASAPGSRITGSRMATSPTGTSSSMTWSSMDRPARGPNAGGPYVRGPNTRRPGVHEDQPRTTRTGGAR